MIFDRFSAEANIAVVVAEKVARGLSHNYVGSEHLLVALAASQGEEGRVLVEAGLDAQTLRERITQMVGASAEVVPTPIPFSPRLREVLTDSLRSCLRDGQERVTPPHLLLALLASDEGLAARLIDEQDARQELNSRAAQLVGSHEDMASGRSRAVAARLEKLSDPERQTAVQLARGLYAERHGLQGHEVATDFSDPAYLGPVLYVMDALTARGWQPA